MTQPYRQFGEFTLAEKCLEPAERCLDRGPFGSARATGNRSRCDSPAHANIVASYRPVSMMQ